MGGFGTGGEEIGGKKIDIRVKNQELRKKKWKEVRSTKLEIIPFKLWICWNI